MATIHTPPTGQASGSSSPVPDVAGWRKATAVAAGVVSVMALLTTVLAGELIPPLVVIALLFAGGAVAIVRTGAVDAAWPGYALAVFGVLALGGSMPFLVADLSHPESAAGFIPQMLLVCAVLLAGLGGVVSSRRAALPLPPVVATFVVVAVMGVIVSIVATATLSDDEAEPGDVEIVAEDVEYPAVVELEAGAVGFLVDNADPFRHTFLIEGTDVAQEVPGSTARRVEVDLEPGTYRYYCDVPGHEDMEGTLTVR